MMIEQKVHLHEPEAHIGCLSRPVFPLDVKSHSNHVARAFRLGGDVFEYGSEYPPAPCIRPDVHTLKPPDPTVSPIAPLVSDHHLADDFAVHFGDEVPAAA